MIIPYIKGYLDKIVKMNIVVLHFNFGAFKMSDENRDKRIIKSEDEWYRELPEDVFNVTRKKSTEKAFSGKYDKLFELGRYRCRCCDTLLFDSEKKFNSGFGWPSFYDCHHENIEERSDNSWMIYQIELVCRTCDAHLGHVFEDGSTPTGLRYCINSVSIKFYVDEK